MAVLSEGKRIGDVVRYEVDGAANAYCRELITLGAIAVDIGTVLDKGTGVLPVAPANADAIALQKSDGSETILALVRGPCIAVQNQMDYGALDVGQTNTQLETLGIVVRSEPPKQEIMPG